MRMARIMSLLLAAGFTLVMAAVASAHAVVFPKQATANSYEKFALRVPAEKDVPTVKVRVEIPEGFAISRVQPLPGWKYEFERAADGTVKAIVWSGGEIGATEFQEFVFQGKTPKDPGKFAFRAWQTYKNGEVAEWTGPSDAKTPASVVEIVPGAAQTDAHGAQQPAAPAPATPAPATPAPATPAPAAAESAQPAGGGFTPVAAYGGLALGALALVLTLRRR